MEDNRKRSLDLDEILGQSKTLVVKWQGREYELIQMDGITPKKSLAFQKMMAKVHKLQAPQEDADISPEEEERLGNELERLVNQSLLLICSDLPVEDIPFGRRMQILTFYYREIQEKKITEATPENLTGVTPSQN